MLNYQKADDVFVLPLEAAIRKGCEPAVQKAFAVGENMKAKLNQKQELIITNY